MVIKSRIFWLGLFFLTVLVATVYLVEKKQETRKMAYFSGAKVMVLPETMKVGVNEEVPVQLWMETDKVAGSDELARASSVDATLCFGSELILDEENLSEAIELNGEAFKTLALSSLSKKGANESCLKLVVLSSEPVENLKSGLFRIATIRFKTVRNGSGRIEVPLDRVFVAGYNPAPGSTDSLMEVTLARGAQYNIGEQKGKAKTCFFLWQWLGWCN